MMNQIELFGEFAIGLEKLSVTITANEIEKHEILFNAPKTITINYGISKYNCVLDNLEFSVDMCHINQPNYFDSASFTVLAKICEKKHEDRRLDHMFNRLIKGKELLCKFCQGKVVNINKVSKIDALLPVDTLAGLEHCSFFCHAKTSACANYGSPLSRAVANLSPLLALCNGVEIIFSQESWFPNSTLQIKGSEGLFCSRCRLMLGRLVGNGSDAVPVLWTNCITVWTEELDIDGDYLRHIEIPFISNDADFFDFLFSQLLDAKCYRILLSAGTVDGPIDYALLWLFDQRSVLYNASMDVTAPRTAVLESSGDSGNVIPSIVSTNTITANRTLISKVLYKLVVPNADASERNTDQNDDWTKDFSVLPVTMPWETCVLLITCLVQVTRHLPPHARSATGQMNGFIVGGIPTRNY